MWSKINLGLQKTVHCDKSYISNFLIFYNNLTGNLLLLCHSSFPKSILETTSHCFHVTHTSSSSCTATFSLFTPVEGAPLSIGIPARSTPLLLDVVWNLSTTTACCVGFIVPLSEWSCTLSLLAQVTSD